MPDLLNFYINDDYVIKESIIDPKRNIGQEEIVMDKKTFKECYKKWILEDDEEAILSGTLKADEVSEQKPTDTDTISRSGLLKAIDTWDKFGCDADTKLVPYKDNYVAYIHYDDVINCIKDMPPVIPAEKVGKWQKISDYRYQCSRCGNVVLFSSEENLYRFSRRCGQCGSNNDKGKRSE